MASCQRALIEDLATGGFAAIEKAAVPGAYSGQKTMGSCGVGPPVRLGCRLRIGGAQGVQRHLLLTERLNRRNREDRDTGSNNRTGNHTSSES